MCPSLAIVHEASVESVYAEVLLTTRERPLSSRALSEHLVSCCSKQNASLGQHCSHLRAKGSSVSEEFLPTRESGDAAKKVLFVTKEKEAHNSTKK